MGGGTRGSFEAGVLKAMSEKLDPRDITYDVVQGVSIGSVNAAMLAITEKGDERRTIKWLENLW